MSKHWIERLAELTVKRRTEPLTAREDRSLRKLTAQMATRTGRAADGEAWRNRGNQTRTSKHEDAYWDAYWATPRVWFPRPPVTKVRFV